MSEGGAKFHGTGTKWAKSRIGWFFGNRGLPGDAGAITSLPTIEIGIS